MKILAIFLLVMLAFAALLTFVFIPLAILYNYNITRLMKKVEKNTNERTVQTFLVWLMVGPLFNYGKMWHKLIYTFKIIDKSDNIGEATKKKLFETYKRRGCNPRKE